MEDANRRIVLHARLLHGNKPLNILQRAPFAGDEQNADNIRETIAYVRHFPGDRIVAGDFNAKPHALNALREHGWIDAWHRLRSGDAGCTFEAGKAELRIDYIWVSKSLDARLRSIDIIADSGVANGARASDHGPPVELE